MNIIFDLDGTISDSSEGVFANFREVFSRYGVPDMPDEELKKYIGPPTEESLARHIPNEKLDEAVETYRKIYKEKNINKNKMYPNMDKLLVYLKSKGHKLYVATTKEIKAAKEILTNFGIMKYYDAVYGADPTNNVFTKTDVLNRLFEQTNAQKDDSIMIGDTLYDVEGAENVGIKVAVVLYGFSPKENFEGRQVEFFAQTVEDLKNYF